MSDVATIEAEAKSANGTGTARAVRRTGRIPGIVYGGSEGPEMVTVEGRVLDRFMTQPGFHNRLFELALNGAKQRVIARDVQLHPVTDKPLHIDFYRVAVGASVTVTIPVHFINEDKAPGLRRGGLLNIVRHEIEVTCPADSLPDTITIDLAGRQIGDSIHISSVTLPPGVEPTITDRDFTVATIGAPSGMSEEAVEGTQVQATELTEEADEEGEESDETEAKE